MTEKIDPVGLLLSDDLIFTSRVAGTAKGLGLTIRAVRSSEALLAQARQQAPGARQGSRDPAGCYESHLFRCRDTRCQE